MEEDTCIAYVTYRLSFLVVGVYACMYVGVHTGVYACITLRDRAPAAAVDVCMYHAAVDVCMYHAAAADVSTAVERLLK